MVAWPDVIDPWETDGVVLHDIDAVGPELLKMVLLERLIIGVIAKAIKHSSDFHPFLSFLPENIKKQGGNGIVAEVEVFKVHATLGLSDGFEHIRKLIFA
jgi:hypothetical protein